MLTSFDHAHYVRRRARRGRCRLHADLEGDQGRDLGGGNVLSPKVIQNLFEATASRASDARDRGGRPAGLTQRETDILALLAEGKSNGTSRALYLSEKTVKAHLAAIFRKLGVTNRTQAAMAAVSMGIGPDLSMVDTGREDRQRRLCP